MERPMMSILNVNLWRYLRNVKWTMFFVTRHDLNILSITLYRDGGIAEFDWVVAGSIGYDEQGLEAYSFKVSYQ